MTRKNDMCVTELESDHSLPPLDDSMGHRSRNLILCSDGTGNRGGVTPNTNVRRLFHAIDRHDHKKDPTRPEQLAFYDDGVGTEELKWLKYFGGAFGWGLSRNIRELYTFLVKNYRPGDRIFLFGFSRGAFTVRSLAGMIARCGIIDPAKIEGDGGLADCVKHTYYAYKYAHFRCQNNLTEADEDLKECGINYQSNWRAKTDYGEGGVQVPIHFIGVWDTVDAVGLPVDELRDGLAGSIRLLARCFDWALRKLPVLKFSGHALQPEVRNAFHALAIDDERQTFHPLLWTQPPDPDPDPDDLTGQCVQQVWFCGMHSNVGGGYPKDQLAHVPLDWMLARAEDCDLRVHPSHREEFDHQINAHGQMHDSRSGLAVYYRYHPRNIKKLWEEAHGARKTWCSGEKEEKSENNQKMPPILVHESVLDRIERTTQDYAPVALPTKFQIVTDDNSEISFQDWLSRRKVPGPEPAWKEKRRTELQEAWKAICGGRLLYFIFLAVNLLFVLLLLRLDSGAPGIGGSGSACIDWLNGKLQWIAPEIVAEPIDALFRHPLWLGFFAGALVIIFRLRAWFRWRIRCHAQRAWCEVRPVHVGAPKPRWFSGFDWTVIIATGGLLWCYGASLQTWLAIGALILVHGLIGRFHEWIHGGIRRAWDWLRSMVRPGNRPTNGNGGDQHD
uniref:Uncharacterized alpha/beta hydrolase domain (DUF2235) n=1 Tax=Candidatus Kentrum sp. SD TaxID=2126332 RepID=A0A451BI59_9GAMM|nr:MAG: Uncharacterized alpha/beta hydrolase domain (DUF2235) [Candidatus Kentron sp. SD]